VVKPAVIKHLNILLLKIKLKYCAVIYAFKPHNVSVKANVRNNKRF